MNRRLIALKIMIEQEKKKAGVLAVLALMLVMAAVRAGLVIGPRESVASISPEDDKVSSLASVGREAVSRAIASDDARNGGRFVEVPRSPAPARNLFSLDPSWYPPELLSGGVDNAPAEQSEQATQIPEAKLSAAAAHEKEVESASQNADELAARQRAQLLEETTGWRLTSVVLGQQPIAVVETQPIGGRGASRSNVLRVGQSLREWLVIEVTSSAVVLEKQSVRVRLSLAKSEP